MVGGISKLLQDSPHSEKQHVPHTRLLVVPSGQALHYAHMYNSFKLHNKSHLVWITNITPYFTVEEMDTQKSHKVITYMDPLKNHKILT